MERKRVILKKINSAVIPLAIVATLLFPHLASASNLDINSRPNIAWGGSCTWGPRGNPTIGCEQICTINVREDGTSWLAAILGLANSWKETRSELYPQPGPVCGADVLNPLGHERLNQARLDKIMLDAMKAPY